MNKLCAEYFRISRKNSNQLIRSINIRWNPRLDLVYTMTSIMMYGRINIDGFVIFIDLKLDPKLLETHSPDSIAVHYFQTNNFGKVLLMLLDS